MCVCVCVCACVPVCVRTVTVCAGCCRRVPQQGSLWERRGTAEVQPELPHCRLLRQLRTDRIREHPVSAAPGSAWGKWVPHHALTPYRFPSQGALTHDRKFAVSFSSSFQRNVMCDMHYFGSSVSIVTRLRARWSGVWIPAEARDLAFLQNFPTGSCTRHPIPRVPWGGFFPASKAVGAWGWPHSCPCSAGVKNEWSYTSAVPLRTDKVLPFPLLHQQTTDGNHNFMSISGTIVCLKTVKLKRHTVFQNLSTIPCVDSGS